MAAGLGDAERKASRHQDTLQGSEGLGVVPFGVAAAGGGSDLATDRWGRPVRAGPPRGGVARETAIQGGAAGGLNDSVAAGLTLGVWLERDEAAPRPTNAKPPPGAAPDAAAMPRKNGAASSASTAQRYCRTEDGRPSSQREAQTGRQVAATNARWIPESAV